jgi:hypothetical protein
MAVFAIPQGAVAQGQASVTTIDGMLIDQQSGLPVANAKVALYRADSHVGDTTSDANGSFRFKNIEPGVYHAQISATGYEPGSSEDIYGFAGQSTEMRAELIRATSSTGSGLREIAAVTASRGSLQTSSIITQQISPNTIQREGVLRAADALLSLPGITANDLDSAPGDDLHLNIRGLPGSETSALLDGHPIGPIGVGSGQRGGYNYQLSPSWGLRNIEVAYGTGGLALYGADTLGGAIDFQTLNPSSKPTATIQQGFGTQGRRQTIVTAGGQAGRVGYAFETSVQGTWGNLKPGTFTQNGLLVGAPKNAPYVADASPSNIATNSYPVSGNYMLRTNLLKLRYDIAPATTLTATGYVATSWDDKSGEGDNDAYSPAYIGAQFDQLAGSSSCVNVKVTDGGGTQCFNRSQYVNQFSGPAGGGGTAWQALRNQDYSLRLNSQKGHNMVAASVFVDTFNTLYDRFPIGTATDNGHVNNYQTVGEELSDDIVTDKNDLGFGVYAYGQSEIDRSFDATGTSTNPTLNASFMNYFVKDSFTPSRHLSVFASAWLKQNSVSNTSSIDPRLTLVYRPTPRDVVRVSAGHAEGVPQIGLLQGAVQYNTSPTNITNPSCNLQTVANAPSKDLRTEKATDVEASIGHVFQGDGNIQLTAFDMNERDVLFGAVEPLASLGLTPPSYLLSQYLQLLQNNCHAPGYSPTVANLGATTVANAGTGRYRGIDITGRIRANRNFFVDYGYNVLSARYFNIPALALQNNLTLIDGGQIVKVPIQQGSLGVDFSDNHGFEVRLDGYYVGSNNGLQRPAYTYANAAITKSIRRLSLNVGIYNVFNSQYDQFGRIGEGVFIPENRYRSDTTALQEAFNNGIGEQFGLPKRSFLFSITERI